MTETSRKDLLLGRLTTLSRIYIESDHEMIRAALRDSLRGGATHEESEHAVQEGVDSPRGNVGHIGKTGAHFLQEALRDVKSADEDREYLSAHGWD